MKRSILLRSPVISIFSPSPAASRRAQDILEQCFGLQQVDLSSNEASSVSSSVSSFTSQSNKWDSVVSRCPTSGVHIHCVAVADSASSSSLVQSKKKSGPFSLISISESSQSTDNVCDTVFKIQSMLSAHMKPPLSPFMKAFKSFNFLGGNNISVLNYFDKLSLPILDFSSTPAQDGCKEPTHGLKEVAFTSFNNNDSPSGSVHSRLKASGLLRRNPALFQWVSPGGGICIRPLPPAEHDKNSTPLVLVFQCKSIVEAERNITSKKECVGVTSRKIGYGGLGKGQLRVFHEELMGLDLRFCQSRKFDIRFNEAQESLMSCVLSELQTENTMQHAGQKGKGMTEAEKDGANCWTEFRATLKRPKDLYENFGR